MSGVVVVGVDGSPGSDVAVDAALRDAARRGARLRAVTAVRSPDYWPTAYGPVPVPPAPAQLADVAAALRRRVERARRRLGLDVPVEAVAPPGPPGAVLVGSAADADLLVLGHRGRGGTASAVLGSVGLHCVLHARCPVTVVPPAPVPTPAAEPLTGPAVPAVP